MAARAFLLLCALVCGVAAQDPPKVVELTPASCTCAVDAAATKALVIKFDRPMRQSGWSLCGGGPKFPKFTGKPAWKNPTMLVIEVALETDHDYELSLNCGTATNFRSAEGIPLEPVPWTFNTLPSKLPNQAEQKKRNQQALAALMKTLDEHYSYHDLRVKDWKKLEHDASPAILAAPTDRAWACAAAAMLAPTQDLHLYLRMGDRRFATGTRAVDPLFRQELIAKYLPTEAAGPLARYGRTDDGIGYLQIAAWERELDKTALDKALASLRDTKGLVVDVRMNSGGDEMLARGVAAWFVEGRKVYAKHKNRERAGKDGLGPVYERALEGNASREQRYDHPIALLTSRYVMSSNESFVMMVRQAKDCTMVGQPTFGSSGNPKPYDLPNGVTIVAPSWQDLRLDGTCLEGEGVAPDVLVEAAAATLKTKDPILEKALELLRAKVKK